MKPILPAREAIKAKGWTHQVQWIEDGKPCFIRCKCGGEADRHANYLKRQHLDPIIIDLKNAMQIH